MAMPLKNTVLFAASLRKWIEQKGTKFDLIILCLQIYDFKFINNNEVMAGDYFSYLIM